MKGESKMNKALMASYVMNEVEKTVRKFGGTITRIATEEYGSDGTPHATVTIRFFDEQTAYAELVNTDQKLDQLLREKS
jgi:hypothetical protein